MAAGVLCFAYYCSGHGYGHATRVSAFSRYLLSFPIDERPIVYIVSSAPEHIFADGIQCGARYRFAEIDPVIVQPLAYRVDRRKSVEGLKKFLRKKDELLSKETKWLQEIKAHSVLSDAAFLGCLAAKEVGIPSILITNFSFDSVYSYLSTPILDVAPSSHHTDSLPAALDIPMDESIPYSELAPLVEQIHAGYRCADLLVRLPGYIPIPSFLIEPSLPSFKWVDVKSQRMWPNIIDDLTASQARYELHPCVPISAAAQRGKVKRSVVQAPLLVRPPSSTLSVYTREGRSKLLSSMGVPITLHDPGQTKILVVSFGGQVFRKPSCSGSRTPSRSVSRELVPDADTKPHPLNFRTQPSHTKLKHRNGLGFGNITNQMYNKTDLTFIDSDLHITPPTIFFDDLANCVTPTRLATPCHLWIPGAPPAFKASATSTMESPTIDLPTIHATPPTPDMSFFTAEDLSSDVPRLLPDSSWIAIVCGVSKEKWASESQDKDSALPEGFYVAPRDVYMPDLTAVGDVLLGKLGYGTVSECVDACTPFVYVSRPLFIEEHGLRLLLDREGIGIELSRQKYEAGDWSSTVTEAFISGQAMKGRKRYEMANGIGVDKREEEGKKLAGTTPPIADLDDLPAEEKAKVLERHLVPKEQRMKAATDGKFLEADGVFGTPDSPHTISRRSSNGVSNRQQEDPESFPIPYDTLGADVTHDIYKWHTDQRRQAARVRAASFAGPSQAPHPAFEHIHEPGGFRRNFVKLRANDQGEEEPQMLNNFIDFLLLFGHFAGEDLEEEEEDKDEDEANANEQAVLSTGLPDTNETTPLIRSSSLSRSRSKSRRRRNSVGVQGTATVTQAVFMLLKSFIGTGVLFLGKGFYNGGLLFSSITFVFIACISLYSFLLLVKTKFVVSGSFGDIGGTLYGPWMRYLILGSIVVSQLGFVAAYMIFVAENLQAFVLGITNCSTFFPVQYFILVQLIVFLPLALVRDLAKLSSTALIADGFILVGLVYIFGSEFSVIARRGIADVKLFNPKDFALFIGTAVFSFEGIGLVIPITDAMKEPHKFPAALTGVMAFLLFLFGGAGILAYLTFGSEIQTVIFLNLDPKNRTVQSVQFIYALAILLSVPLQFFPAVRIMENGLFTRSGKADPRVKWQKNAFRFSMVIICTIISWVGAADLDKFVAFIGCFACVPLCYVYPAMLHYKAISRTRKQKLADIALIVFGLFAAAYTTIQTLRLMMAPSPGSSPYENCEG
ncbi:hypothetical protein BYT27DRAFT_7226400 [Phlegmacium glaucopus]|nr:hypothetical protein BYT27DRAFT_7226400 [Phlegmacium glaucopus]